MDASNFSELWVCIKLLTSFRNIAMDRCCNAQMIAESTGRKLKVLDHKTASLTRDQVGSNWAYVAIHVRCPLIMLMSNALQIWIHSGWFMAQPYFDLALQQNPDAFD